MTNNRIVLESVPEKDRAKNINEIDLSEESTVERALESLSVTGTFT
jgi:hypothetical protein